MSWKGETGTPSFSTKHLNSLVCKAPIFLGWNSDGCLLYDMVDDGDEEAVAKCREIASERWEAMMADVDRRKGEEMDF